MLTVILREGEMNKLENMAGKEYVNSFGTRFVIVEYINNKNVIVQFQDDNKFLAKTRMRNIRMGSVPNPFDKTVVGIGCIGVGKYSPTDGKKATAAYDHWRSMLLRCYCSKTQLRVPTYRGYTVCEEWLCYQDFAEWFYSNEFSSCGYHLDKDVLPNPKKIYSPETCCLIPREINNTFNTNSRNKGVHPQGVQPHNNSGKFSAKVKVGGFYKYIGVFNTQEKAYEAYKAGKEERVKEVAMKWKNKVDEKVFNALMNWTVD